MSRDLDGGGSAPVPLEQLRELVRGHGAWCVVGVVTDRNGQGHFEIEDGDVRVDVLLQSGEHVWARLGGIAGGSGVGIYSIPDPGAECLVALPDGRKDGEALLVGFLSTGKLPDGLDGSGTVIIAVKAGQKVLVHDGTAGDAKALATKDDVDNHTHPLPVLVAGMTTVTSTPGPSTISTEKPAAITGTSVLKAK